MEIDDTGAIFDESLADATVMEDGFAWWRQYPIGNIAGTQSWRQEFPDAACFLIDVNSARRVKADEQRLILQLQANSWLSFAALTDYVVAFSLRVLWRVSASSGP